MVDVYLENDIIAKQQNSFFNALFSKNFLVNPIQDLASNPFSAIFDLILSAAQVYTYAIIERFWNRKPIRRGYLLANFNEGKPSVDHLIFVIHGIGQRGDTKGIREHTRHIQKTMELIDDAEKVKNKKMAVKYCIINRKGLSNMKSSKNRLLRKPGLIRNVAKRRISYKKFKFTSNNTMVIPIEWRSIINIPEDTLELITPITNIREMRRNIHFTLMDVMYYMSPEYQNEIISKAISRFNDAYSKFMNYNSKFKGSISIIGHSLGSVITYDIMTEYEARDEEENEYFESNVPLRRAISLEGSPLIEETEKLAFRIDNAFLFGSPLALFLVARGKKYQQSMLIQLKNPKTKYHIYNIIHPMDPIAYRIEPLFHPIYSDNTPEPIFPCYSQQAARIYANPVDLMSNSQNTQEYYHCATDLAASARRAYTNSSRAIPKSGKLQNRLDYYVLPLLEEMGHWSALTNHSSY
uniref:DDHD domain-containing protein n=1 Tax=Acrobeloides nanus TaxID=290746 RepID=A0A914CTD9_9BILA